MLNRFAIIIHSYASCPGRPARTACFNPQWWYRFLPSKAVAFNGIGSPHGRAKGFLIVINYDTFQLQRLSSKRLLKRVMGAGEKAVRLGARVIGFSQPLLQALGSSAAALARHLSATVTSGAGCAAAGAIDGMNQAAVLMGINPEEASVLIMGAAEPLGSACAQMLAGDGVNYLTLVDRDRARLEHLSRQVLFDYGVASKISGRMSRAVAQADLILVAKQAADVHLDPLEIKPGAVVCNLSAADKLTLSIMQHRPDVAIFDQAVLRLPGAIELDYDLGLPEAEIYAPMAEALLLALEGKFDRYFLGPRIRVDKILGMRNLAQKHGLILSGLAALNGYFDFNEITAIKNRSLAQGLRR